MVDTMAPVLSLLGDASVTVDCGSTYTDAGVLVSADCDPDVDDNIVTVNPALPIKYIISNQLVLIISESTRKS